MDLSESELEILQIQLPYRVLKTHKCHSGCIMCMATNVGHVEDNTLFCVCVDLYEVLKGIKNEFTRSSALSVAFSKAARHESSTGTVTPMWLELPGSISHRQEHLVTLGLHFFSSSLGSFISVLGRSEWIMLSVLNIGQTFISECWKLPSSFPCLRSHFVSFCGCFSALWHLAVEAETGAAGGGKKMAADCIKINGAAFIKRFFFLFLFLNQNRRTCLKIRPPIHPFTLTCLHNITTGYVTSRMVAD